MSNDECPNPKGTSLVECDSLIQAILIAVSFDIGIWSFFSHSDFDIRHSSPPLLNRLQFHT